MSTSSDLDTNARIFSLTKTASGNLRLNSATLSIHLTDRPSSESNSKNPSKVLGMASLGPAGATLLSLNFILWAKIRFLGPKLVINRVDCRLGLEMLESPKLQYWPFTIRTTVGNATWKKQSSHHKLEFSFLNKTWKTEETSVWDHEW